MFKFDNRYSSTSLQIDVCKYIKYIDMKADTGSEYLLFSKKKAYADDTLSVF